MHDCRLTFISAVYVHSVVRYEQVCKMLLQYISTLYEYMAQLRKLNAK